MTPPGAVGLGAWRTATLLRRLSGRAMTCMCAWQRCRFSMLRYASARLQGLCERWQFVDLCIIYVRLCRVIEKRNGPRQTAVLGQWHGLQRAKPPQQMTR